MAKEPNEDLCLLKRLRREQEALYSQSKPIRIASKGPERKDQDVYIVGYHHYIDGLKKLQYIPAKFVSNVGKLAEEHPQACYFEIHSAVIKDKKFDCRSLSGSPVVNKCGELLGIVGRADVDDQGIPTSPLFALDLKTIQNFLEEHPINKP